MPGQPFHVLSETNPTIGLELRGSVGQREPAIGRNWPIRWTDSLGSGQPERCRVSKSGDCSTDVGITDRIGAHSMRKSWGYQAQKEGVPIDLIQKKLGHSSPGVTRR